MNAGPHLLGLAVGRGTLTIVALAGGRLELRASVRLPDAGVYPHDVFPYCLEYLELRSSGGEVEVVHGSEGHDPPAVYRSTDEGRHLTRSEPPPTDAVIRRVESYPDGGSVAVEDWRSDPGRPPRVWVRPPAGAWAARPLPAGLLPRRACRSPDGTIYVAGGRLPRPHASAAGPIGPGRRPPATGWAEQALAVIRGDAVELTRPPLTDENRARITANWMFAQHLESVDAAGDPLVASTHWMDDGADCVLVADVPHWNVLPHRLHDPFVVRHRPGEVTVYATDGRRFRTRDRGRTWRGDDLRPAIRAAWPVRPGPSDLIVVDLDVRGDAVAVIARAWEDPAAAGDAILYSADDGATFSAVTGPGAHAAFQRVCLLP